MIQQSDVDEDEEKPPAIGLLLDLYQSVGNDPNRAKIKWYFLHEELPKAMRASVGTMLKEKFLIYRSLSSSFFALFRQL